MIIQEKIWGKTGEIFSKNNVEIHRIEIIKGGYCSRHYHEYKYNGFFLESGKLTIHLYKKDSNIEDITTLRPGDYTIVEPQVDHMFLAIEDSIAYEIYWSHLPENDIIRKNSGGIKQ
jgi:quercetin dioxygenase-like cupin family protein